MEIIDGTKTVCSRCDETIPLEDAVCLEHKQNKHMEKPLCESCLEDIGVPREYELERDITYLAR